MGCEHSDSVRLHNSNDYPSRNLETLEARMWFQTRHVRFFQEFLPQDDPVTSKRNARSLQR